MSTFVRSLDFFLAVSGAVLQITVGIPLWRVLSRPEVLARIGYVVLLLSVAYATAESQIRAVPIGPRSILLTVALVYVNVALLWIGWNHWRRRQSRRTHEHR